jgi:multidrug efflux pump subunit AcrA (membrane-fusion protein)
MRIRIIAAVLLIAVGIGAVAFTMFPPGSSSSSATKYVTTAATRTDVVKSVVATGTVGPVELYALAFGSLPVATSSASSSSSSAASSSGSTSVTWKVLTATATVGQVVKSGDALATADPSDAQLALTVAQASLAAAQAKLSADQAGLNANDKAAAQLSVTQAQQSLTQAQTAQSQTTAQNNLKISQQTAAVTAAQAKLAADEATVPAVPAATITADQSAITQAQNAQATLKLQNDQSNVQAANSVRSAQLQLQSAQIGYNTKTAASSAATIASDQANVSTAQQNVDAAQVRIDGAVLTSPVDGVVLAVNITPGVNAPSGTAITVQSSALQVSASVAESDLPSLTLGQAADVTITATKLTAAGKVTQISPSGSAGSGGGVVTYAILVSLPTPPKGTAAGMSAQISVTTASAPSVIAVPSIALVTSNGGYAVRVLDAAGAPQAVPVQVGLVTSSLAEIQSGISEGQAVVVGTSSTRTGTTTTTGIGIGAGGFGGGGIGAGGRPGGG